jgi:protein O-GlcNAc transferase
MGNIFLDQGKNEAARKYFTRAVELDPMLPEAHISLGIAHQNLGQGSEAVACFEAAIDFDPGYAKPYCHLVRTLQHECRWDQLKKYGAFLDGLTQAAVERGRKPNEMPFLHLTRHQDPAFNLQVAKSWSDQLVSRVASEKRRLHAHLPRQGHGNHKITLGYLSNNYKNHPTAHLIAGLFRYHDRKRFNLHCYSYGADDGSIYRQLIEAACDRFVDIEKSSHYDSAQRIRRDGVDILVDLVGYMKANRMEIPALKPAPIQVRWLGMAGSCGADFFDYIITDEIVTPQDQALHYTETFAYMPSTYQINDDRQLVAEEKAQRCDWGLPPKEFVYACFCSTYKIDPTMFRTWMTILGNVPGSVLWLLEPSQSAQARLRAEAQKHAIAPRRIIFAPKVDRSEHLTRLRLADLCLDTRLVNGAATTSEALWAGVPVLTIQGSHFASRMAASILTAFDMPELITTHLDTYIRVGIRMGSDREYCRSMRSKVATGRNTTVLFDTPVFVKNLENIFEMMWHLKKTGQKSRILRMRPEAHPSPHMGTYSVTPEAY